MAKKVYVTGLGMVSPVGVDLSNSWNSLIEGSYGIATIESFDPSGFETTFAGEIAEFDSTAYQDQKEKLQELIFTRRQNGYFQAWMDELKENADIIDNRKFYF